MADVPEIAIGRVVAAHGVDGELRVEPWTDVPERFRPGVRVFVQPGPGWTLIRAVRRHGQAVLLRLEGVEDRDAAQALCGARLLVTRAERAPLPEGRYYTLDLLGWPVVAPDGRLLGRLHDVLPNPAHDLLEVEQPDGRRALVPAVRALVRVDAEARRIVVEPLPGLLGEG